MDRVVCLVCFWSALSLALAQDTSPAADTAKPEAVLFDALPVVQAASLHTQTLMDAPASVTVITAEEIQRRGYRTLAEALADVRGFYVSYDRAYDYVGVRGFLIPGDYDTRFLMMINGHSLTENVYGSAGYFGQDFGLDMDLIQRIEIIRGPSSALYGSNGMFATINIVTKSPVDYPAWRVAAETDSFGERKAEVSSSQYLGRGANVLISASAFNNIGQDLYFPQFDSPATNHGWAIHMDGERGYHTFANLIWRGWSFMAYFNSREKLIPTSEYGAVFNDRGSKMIDVRGFVESAYRRNFGVERELRWRLYYDRYRSADRFDLPMARFGYPDDATIIDGRQGGAGDWLGTELSYRFRAPWRGFLTVGSEANWDLRSMMYVYEAAPQSLGILDTDHLNRSVALFGQQEWALTPRWKVYLGGRLDDSRYYGVSLTPRVGLIYQPSGTTSVKLLYGRSFRDPTGNEEFYNDGMTQLANPALEPERMQTVEGVFEKQAGKRWNLSTNVYHYNLQHLITATPLGDGLQQYQNANEIDSAGVELEAVGNLKCGAKLDTSLSIERTRSAGSGYVEVNSPARVAKLLLEAPVARNHLWVSGALQYLSERRTFAGAYVPAVYLINLTLASRRLPGGLDVQFGIRNLTDRRYWDPIGTNQGMDVVEQDGRSFFARVTWGPETEKRPEKSSPGSRPPEPRKDEF
jgi:outer membrane receptor protein involved in Fe transport